MDRLINSMWCIYLFWSASPDFNSWVTAAWDEKWWYTGLLVFAVNNCQVQYSVRMWHDLAVSGRLLCNHVHRCWLSLVTSTSNTCCSYNISNEPSLSWCRLFLTIGQNAQIVDNLSRADSIHILNYERISSLLLVLESLHQMLCFGTSCMAPILLISVYLLVPGRCQWVVV